MSHFIFGHSRHQANLPEVLDDFIAKENPVRVIDVFVNELDMARLSFKRASPKNTGRPGYDPATMLKLYIYPALSD